MARRILSPASEYDEMRRDILRAIVAHLKPKEGEDPNA
jgi:hypothetical protein